MHIFSLVLSIIALGICWVSIWSIPVTLLSLIISLIVMNKFFFSDKKDKMKKGKGLVFSAFILSMMAMIGSLIMAGIPVSILLLS